MKNKQTTRRGFTLIELLITILIIGVLATIAVSAYQKAVLKSRFSSIIPPTKAIAESQEFYYMNTGNYATDMDELDIRLKDNEDIVLSLSEKEKYKYVMGSHSGAGHNHYVVYQKHSPKFADNIHCEARKGDAKAKWLCESGLGGTLLSGSISGKDYETYLLSGDGIGNFLRDDCAAGYYDNEGTCTKAPAGSYAVEGELRTCEGGTYSAAGASSCSICGNGKYSEEGATGCTNCPAGWAAPAGSASCTQCQPGTHPGKWSIECVACSSGTYSEDGIACTNCPAGWAAPAGSVSCTQCQAGTYPNKWKSECVACGKGYYSADGAASCTKCPEGTTSNEDHTACI